MNETELLYSEVYRALLRATHDGELIDLEDWRERLDTLVQRGPWLFFAALGSNPDYKVIVQDDCVLADRRTASIFLSWACPGFGSFVIHEFGERLYLDESLAEHVASHTR